MVADTAGKWPYAEDLTADFVYCRLHGAEQLYVSGYSDRELDWWADRVEHWRRGSQPRDANFRRSKSEGRKARRLHLFRQRREGPRALQRQSPGEQAFLIVVTLLPHP